MIGRYLLDTHTLMWLIGNPSALSKTAFNIIVYSECELYCSLISFWEIAIKVSIGKLQMSDDWQRVYEQALITSDIKLVDINLAAITLVQELLLHHRDPFDRMLIVQAMVNELTFISADSKCQGYDLDMV